MLNERDYMKRDTNGKLKVPKRNLGLWPIIVAGFLVLFMTLLFFKTRAPQPTVSLPTHTNPNMRGSSPQTNAAKIIEDKSELPAHLLRKWILPMSQRATIQWHLEAASPVSLFVFQTHNDVAKYLAHQPYNTYNCSAQNIKLSDGTCTIEPQAVFALENRTDASVTITLSVTSP